MSGERGSRKCRKTPRNIRRQGGCRGKRCEAGGKRIRGLKARAGQKCCISRGGPDCTMKVYKLKESEEEDTVFAGVGYPEETGTQ